MKHGTKLIVSSGHGSFKAWFLSWIGDTDKMSCINSNGCAIVVSQCDVLEMFI